ncbi:NupC/NupG family nucleoside CNT transporter, partial [Idiomarina sp. UBA4206]
MNSILGVAVIFIVAYLVSTNRKAIRWRTVLGAFGIQVLLAGFVLYVPIGRELLFSFAQGVSAVIGYTKAGIDFLFGNLASEEFGFVFAIQVLSVIVFFSSLISVLYYLGIMKWVIRILGGGLQKLLGTSRPESMSAAANIFVGQTEAPMMVRPFIGTMTRSELFAVMVGGMASVSGSVLAGYAGVGVELKYLIAASFMAAPGGFLMAKMMIPECEKPRNDLEEVEVEDNSANVIDAAAQGAS